MIPVKVELQKSRREVTTIYNTNSRFFSQGQMEPIRLKDKNEERHTSLMWLDIDKVWSILMPRYLTDFWNEMSESRILMVPQSNCSMRKGLCNTCMYNLVLKWMNVCKKFCTYLSRFPTLHCLLLHYNNPHGMYMCKNQGYQYNWRLYHTDELQFHIR